MLCCIYIACIDLHLLSKHPETSYILCLLKPLKTDSIFQFLGLITNWPASQPTKQETNKLTNSKEQSPSGEISNKSRIPCILWNPKVHDCVQRAHHFSFSWARWSNPIPCYCVSLRSILKFTHPPLSLPSGLFPPGFLITISFFIYWYQ